MYDLLKYVTTSTALIAALTFLARKYFEGFFAKDLALFTHSLSNESESFKQSLLLQTEKFRANLQEQQLVFGQLYQKRASILSDIYTLMDKAITSMETFVRETDSDNERSREAKFREAAKAAQDFQVSFRTNRIWLSEDLSKKIEAVLQENDQIVQGYNSALKLKSEEQASDFPENQLLVIWERVDKEMPNVRASLEKEFRTLLRVEGSTPSPA